MADDSNVGNAPAVTVSTPVPPTTAAVGDVPKLRTRRSKNVSGETPRYKSDVKTPTLRRGRPNATSAPKIINPTEARGTGDARSVPDGLKSKTVPKSSHSTVISTSTNEWAEFLQIEEENRKLRRMFGEKLRKENASLRKRLGI